MSKEYTAALVLILGAVLKFFDIGIPNETIEAIVTALLGLFIAVARFRKGDITIAGVRRD